MMPAIRSLSETEAAYIAGFIDADGHITCIHPSRDVGRHRVTIGVTQANPAILSWIAEKIGGGRVTFRAKSGVAGNPIYRYWLTRQKDVRDLLIQLIPYLVIKREKAEFLYSGKCYRETNLGKTEENPGQLVG